MVSRILLLLETILPIFKYSRYSHLGCRFCALQPYRAVDMGRKKQRRATLRRFGLLSCLERFDIFCSVSCFSVVFASSGMFRASIRSASDPLRDHVCLSCLSHRFGAPSRLRQFHARPALRVEAGNGTSENNSKDAPLPPKPNQGIGLPKEVQCQQSWITFRGNV